MEFSMSATARHFRAGRTVFGVGTSSILKTILEGVDRISVSTPARAGPRSARPRISTRSQWFERLLRTGRRDRDGIHHRAELQRKCHAGAAEAPKSRAPELPDPILPRHSDKDPATHQQCRVKCRPRRPSSDGARLAACPMQYSGRSGADRLLDCASARFRPASPGEETSRAKRRQPDPWTRAGR